MQNALRIMSVLAVWSVLVTVVIYVDPETIKDILLPQVYLPMIILVGAVVGYTAGQFIAGWKLVGLTLFVMFVTGVLLLL